MPEHHTRQVTLDKLDDAVQRLSQGQISLTEGQASLSQNHHSLNIKIDNIHASLTTQIESLFDRLAAVAVPHSSPVSATQPPPPPPLTIDDHHELPLLAVGSPHEEEQFNRSGIFNTQREDSVENEVSNPSFMVSLR